MDRTEVLAFIRTHHHGVLSTYRQDGTAQMSPVVAAVDDQGRVIVSTRETAVKTHNLLRDPRVALVAFTDRFYGPWVSIWGRGEVVHLPEAMEPLVDYYRGVSGEHPDWDEYRAAMERELRVLVRIVPERWGPERLG